VITDRQRNTMVKAKIDCGFNYLLSYKTVRKGDEEKKYIGTLKCLTHTHELYLNPFSFKVYEKSTIEYQALVAQAHKYRIGKLSYAESQQLLEQERLGMTISQKTFYNLFRKQPGDSKNPSTINGLLAVLDESDFVYRTRTKGNDSGPPSWQHRQAQHLLRHCG
jgi:hypothetical protein